MNVAEALSIRYIKIIRFEKKIGNLYFRNSGSGQETLSVLYLLTLSI